MLGVPSPHGLTPVLTPDLAVVVPSLRAVVHSLRASWAIAHPLPRRCCLSPQGELDELEREEFFRLKKVQGNKKKHAEAAEALEAAKTAGAKGGAPAAPAGARENEAANVLATELQDADIIF